MSLVVSLLLAAVLLGGVAATLFWFFALQRGLSDQWDRAPADRRRRGIAAGVVVAVAIVAATILSIWAPWGPLTVLYVLGVGGGVAILLMLVLPVMIAVREVRGSNAFQPPARRYDSIGDDIRTMIERVGRPSSRRRRPRPRDRH